MSICLQNSGSVNITLRVACTRSRSCLNRGKSQSTGLEKRNRVIWDVFKQKQHWPKVLAHSMRHFDCESLPTFHSSSKNCWTQAMCSNFSQKQTHLYKTKMFCQWTADPQDKVSLISYEHICTMLNHFCPHVVHTHWAYSQIYYLILLSYTFSLKTKNELILCFEPVLDRFEVSNLLSASLKILSMFCCVVEQAW